jgi:hypothetical protein
MLSGQIFLARIAENTRFYYSRENACSSLDSNISGSKETARLAKQGVQITVTIITIVCRAWNLEDQFFP